MKSRRGKSSRKYRATFRTKVKKAVMRNSETKYYDIGFENNQLFHNLGWGQIGVPPTTVTSIPSLFNPWVNIPAGTSRAQRIGDKITPRGMSLKLYLANKNDRPYCKIRVIVAVLPKTVAGNIIGTAFDPFQIPQQGLLGQTHLYPPDLDTGVKFLYDRIFTIGTGQDAVTTKEKTKYVRLWIKSKKSKQIVYNSTGNTIVNRPIAVYCIPYEQFDTTTTSNCASVAGFLRMYYKDI